MPNHTPGIIGDINHVTNTVKTKQRLITITASKDGNDVVLDLQAKIVLIDAVLHEVDVNLPFDKNKLYVPFKTLNGKDFSVKFEKLVAPNASAADGTPAKPLIFTFQILADGGKIQGHG